MIDTHFDSGCSDNGRSAVRYVLRPNQSWTWKANIWFLGMLCTVSLLIALSFAVRGFWMVLPFSVLEVMVLVGCIWLCVRRGYRQEVLVLEPETVILRTGQRDSTAEQAVTRRFERFFTRFHVEPTAHSWRSTRVLLRCRNERHEIGSFLTTDEKQELISALRQGIRYLERERTVSEGTARQ